TTTTPFENRDQPLNPLLMVLSYGASWVGQGYAGRPHELSELIGQAIAHRGFSYLHILSPCVTFDKTDLTYENLDLAVRDLPDDHDPSSRMAALREAELGGRPQLGVYYREQRPTLGQALDDIARQAGGLSRVAAE
ncbi:MAG: 2-oxoacid:ferredoxin oxidoreductase subunit beta, partial [Alphaproteobacteria bacterium]|nr:2-oxoacid:ferredoxin oxidoreductase subunit beta [Alphaproteobacteria bacterium]